MDHRDLAQARERAGDVGAAAGEEDALPVGGVGADADVGGDREVGRGVLDRPDRSRHDVVPLARDERGLVLAIRASEDEQTGEPGDRRGARLANGLRHGDALEAAGALDALALLDGIGDDDREDEPGGETVRSERPLPGGMLGKPPSGEGPLAHAPMVRRVFPIRLPAATIDTGWWDEERPRSPWSCSA